MYKGVDPLTPDDIAEVVVFTAGRKENVVIADTLIFPNHQVNSPIQNPELEHADTVTGICHTNASKILMQPQSEVK